MCENDQNPESRKKRAMEADPHSWKPTAPEAEPELCHFCDSFAALNNPRCNRAHRRSRAVFLKVGGIAPMGAILNDKGETGGRNNIKGAKMLNH